jgi:tetratricopeptide (TPR) repeat protein
VLVGRGVLLQAGERALQSALAGRGRVLLLAGEAGIGKTTLALALLERAAALGAQTRIGACWEGEGLPPFTPWIDALRRPGADACADAAEVLQAGDVDAVDAGSAQRAIQRRFGEVVDGLAAAARDRPQVVLLEDLHWADESSLQLMVAVAAHVATMGVLVVGTYRDDELHRANPLASVGGNAERLWLSGLDRDGVTAVLEEVLGRPPAQDEVALVERQTSGNPLFVTQVARLLDVGGGLLPSGVRDILERRLARVSARCDAVLGVAAVLGTEFDEGQLAALDGGSVGDALDEARAARLLEPVIDDPGRWRFVHALVQTTRYDLLGTEQRAALHTRAVEALAGAPAAALAHHATRGRFAAADRRPADLLVAAGREALLRLAWAEATSSFERALALAPEGPDRDEVVAEAWLGIGAARLRQGQSDVRSAFDEAASAARRIGRGDLLARAALGFGVGLGAFEVHLVDRHQIDLLEEAAGALADTDALLPLVLARLSVALAFVESDERRIELAERAVALARAGLDPVVLGHALAAWCDAIAGPDAVGERLAAASEIVRLSQTADDLPLELLGRRLRVVALLEHNDHALADQEVAAYESAAARLGDPLYTWYGRLWRAVRAHAQGELAEAERLTAEAAALGRAGGSVNAEILTVVFAFMAAVDRRDGARADRLVAEMLSSMPDTMDLYRDFTMGYAAALLGRRSEGLAALGRITPATLDTIPRDSEWLCCIVQLATSSARLGDDRWAPLLVDLLEGVADVGCVEGIGAYLHGAAHRYLAIASAVAGDDAATRSHVEAAAVAAAGAGRLLEALTQLDGAWALARLDAPADRARAAALAASAAQTFSDVGLPELAGEAAALGSRGGGDGATALVTRPDPAPARAAHAVRQGDSWAWTWDGMTVHVRHAKGIADLAVLLERAGREVHVRELEGIGELGVSPTAQPVLDEQAVRSYKERLADLEDDLDEADRHGDLARAAALGAERDALVDELSAAFGLGGRARAVGSAPDERLRKAVSARVRASIGRIEALSPALGRHLRGAVRTGFWCAYEPEHPVTWTIER